MLLRFILCLSLFTINQLTASSLNDPRYTDNTKKARWTRKQEIFDEENNRRYITTTFENDEVNKYTVGILEKKTTIISEDEYSYTKSTSLLFVDGTIWKNYKIIKYCKNTGVILSSKIDTYRQQERLQVFMSPPRFHSENANNQSRRRENNCCTIS